MEPEAPAQGRTVRKWLKTHGGGTYVSFWVVVRLTRGRAAKLLVPSKRTRLYLVFETKGTEGRISLPVAPAVVSGENPLPGHRSLCPRWHFLGVCGGEGRIALLFLPGYQFC